MPGARKTRNSGRKTRKHGVRAMRLSPEERRSQLLACAIRVFAEHGLAAANHALVAEEARVSVPTVFFYFHTREALVDAVVAEVERFYTTALASANDPSLPAELTLLTMSHTMTGTLETDPDYSRILMEWSVSVRSSIWPRYLKMHNRITRTVAKVIERGQREGAFRRDVDPFDEAAILHSASRALIQMKETGASPERMERFQRSIVQSVLVQNHGKEARVGAQRRRPVKRRRVAH